MDQFTLREFVVTRRVVFLDVMFIPSILSFERTSAAAYSFPSDEVFGKDTISLDKIGLYRDEYR